ncbi:PREDICTED: gastrokine-1 [Chrysochloris asiatica]|uniref:Gastrokine-1 n=1 Tax=Chrysochloris asiatica TaxID=185453 RepID=A0A9B0WNF7_CHRAS|nr:PREDICTED: gastrokine-1 [Chrysochloris asiatica]
MLLQSTVGPSNLGFTFHLSNKYKYQRLSIPSPCLPSPLLHCLGEDKMKLTIFFAGLLGVFLAPALADYNINVNGDNSNAGSGQQSISVNNEHNMANVDNNNGWNSWNTLWDYRNGFAATRLFAKKLCIVHRINKDVVPPIHALEAMVKENKIQGKGPGGPPPKGLMYSINPNQVDDLSKFGNSIANMCRKIPTYTAEEMQGASLFFFSGHCFNANVLWVLNISFCGRTLEN